MEQGQAHLEQEYPCMAAVNRAASLIDRHDARLIWLTYKPEGSLTCKVYSEYNIQYVHQYIFLEIDEQIYDCITFTSYLVAQLTVFIYHYTCLNNFMY